MRPDPRFQFHIAVVGEGNAKTMVVTQRANDGVRLLPGTRCLVNDGDLPLLRAWIAATPGNELAGRWGVDENALWRLRKALGLAAEYSGHSAVTHWRKTGSTVGAVGAVSPASDTPIEAHQPDTPITIAFAGDTPARRYMLVELPSLGMAHRGNILVQPECREQFGLWLANHTVTEAAEQLGVGRRTIMDARYFCGVRGR